MEKPQEPNGQVNPYIPPRPPPTRAELAEERRHQGARQAAQIPEMSPKAKFLYTFACWLASCLFTALMLGNVIDVFGKAGLAALFALFGWPIPLYYLYRWHRPQKSKP